MYVRHLRLVLCIASTRKAPKKRPGQHLEEGPSPHRQEALCFRTQGVWRHFSFLWFYLRVVLGSSWLNFWDHTIIVKKTHLMFLSIFNYIYFCFNYLIINFTKKLKSIISCTKNNSVWFKNNVWNRGNHKHFSWCSDVILIFESTSLNHWATTWKHNICMI